MAKFPSEQTEVLYSHNSVSRTTTFGLRCYNSEDTKQTSVLSGPTLFYTLSFSYTRTAFSF